MGLFYFNAYYLYTKLLNRQWWWLYVISLGILIVGVFGLKIVILKNWFPGLASNRDAVPFTVFPIIFFLILSTVFRLVTDKISLEKNQLAMELKFLRSQVNPHFLFNVLNNLVSMARHRSDQVEPSLMKLSGLMRYMLYESDEKKIPLNAECQYLRNYISLQELRFDEDVVIQSHIPEGDDGYTIAPMVLIPFVENAFKHGITLQEKPTIQIDLKLKEDQLYFKVTNRFENEISSKDNNSGVGLGNVKARLKLLYPRRHNLLIKKNNGFFEVDLYIKLNHK